MGERVPARGLPAWEVSAAGEQSVTGPERPVWLQVRE